MRDTISWYGCRRDTKDQRDHMFVPKALRLPAKVDLEPDCPPVMDQGSLGSCTAHGTLCAARYELIHNGEKDLDLSRLQLYYDTRAIEHTTKEDAGAEIRNAIKAVSKTGAAHEQLWPYAVKKFAVKPPAPVYKDSKLFHALTYQRVQVSAPLVKAALAGGQPVVIGLTLYESFEGLNVEKTGIVPMPKKTEAAVGGHCMCIIGYGQHKGYFKVRNSWAKDWGDGGNCYIPEAYIGNTILGSDYWVISAFSDGTS